MFDLDEAVADWRRQMLVVGIQTPVPLDELESHLRDEIERQTKSGMSETEAFKTAVQKIGQAHQVQNEFKKVEKEAKAGDCNLLLTVVVLCAGMIASGIGSMMLFRVNVAARIILGLGLGFELPAVLLLLVKKGILNYGKLAGLRRFVIVWNFILGALLTTPEIITQVIMAAALQGLYEASARVAWYWECKAKRAENNWTGE